MRSLLTRRHFRCTVTNGFLHSAVGAFTLSRIFNLSATLFTHSQRIFCTPDRRCICVNTCVCAASFWILFACAYRQMPTESFDEKQIRRIRRSRRCGKHMWKLESRHKRPVRRILLNGAQTFVSNAILKPLLMCMCLFSPVSIWITNRFELHTCP